MNKFNTMLKKNIEDILYYDPEESIEQIIALTFETIMKSERTEFLSENIELNKANGYYPRMIRAINKYLRIDIPRDRLGLFKPVFLEALKQEESRVQDLAFKLYVKGLSTQDIADSLGEFFDKKMSKATISNITANYIDERKTWLERKLEDEYLFLYVDALYIPVRRETVEKEAFYIVMGLRKDLKREILGVYNIPTESAEGWRTVFEDIKKRGFKNTLMVIADGLTGLEKIVKEELPMAKFQKCIVHKIRRILLKARTSHKEELAYDFKEVFCVGKNDYTEEKAAINLESFLLKWKKQYPHIRRYFQDQHLQHYFAYLNFPYQIQSMIYTTNWIESLNKIIRKTQRVRNSFPTTDSAMNLICWCIMDREENNYGKHPVTSFSCVKEKLVKQLEGLSQTQFI